MSEFEGHDRVPVVSRNGACDYFIYCVASFRFDQARYALARLLKRKGCDEEAAVELKELQRRSPAFPVPPALSAALEPWMAATSTLYATGMAPVLSRKASNAVVAASSSPPKVSTLAAVAETPEVVDTPVEAAAALTDTVEPGSVAEDVIGDAVDETGDAGGSDSETEGTIESARTAEASLAFSTALPVFDFKGSRMFSSAPLSAEERQREFIAAMKRDKEAAEVRVVS